MDYVCDNFSFLENFRICEKNLDSLAGQATSGKLEIKLHCQKTLQTESLYRFVLQKAQKIFAKCIKDHVFKMAPKIDEIFTTDLTLRSKGQIDGEDFMNFCGLLRKHEL